MPTVPKCLTRLMKQKNATVENGATIQQSTDMESTAVEATNQTYVSFLKKDAAVTSMLPSQPML